MPSFHFKCRCDIDVVVERISRPVEPRPEPPIRKPVAPPIRTQTILPSGQPPPITVPAGEFIIPKLPNRSVIRSETQRLSDLWSDGIDKRDFKKFREESENFLEKNWGLSHNYDRSAVHNKSIEILPAHKIGKKIAGWHDFFGNIAIRRDEALGVRQGFGMTRAGELKDLSGLHTVVHELVHGANRVKSSAYKLAGKVICEVSTELASRKVVTQMAGKVVERVANVTFSHAYQDAIDKVSEKIGKVYGWEKLKVAKQMKVASIMVNSTKVKTASSYEEVVMTFVRELPGSKEMGEKKIWELYNELEQLKPTW
jgi:hypothetical protein